MGLFFYRTSPIVILSESFEYLEDWYGTIADLSYYKTYVFTATDSLAESFETSEGW